MAHQPPSDNSNPPSPLRERAEQLVRTSPTNITEMTTEAVQRLVHELQIHQVELELQNEELREAQVELAETRDRYMDLYEFAPIGYVTLNEDGKILEANLTAATMLGVERGVLLGANLARFVSRESQDDIYLHRQAVFSSDTRQLCEIEMGKADGTLLGVRLESIAFATQSQRCCRTALIDITERQQTHQQLQQLNETLEERVAYQTREIRLLAEAISRLGEGVLITSNVLDWPGPQIVFVNEAMCHITGYPADELVGQSPRILQGERTSREALDRIKADLQAGRSCSVELINYRKDGTPYDAELLISPLFDSQGRRNNYVSIHRDITERKQVEKALRESEAQTRAILASLSAHIAVVDRTGTIVAVNPAWEQFARDNSNGGKVVVFEPRPSNKAPRGWSGLEDHDVPPLDPLECLGDRCGVGANYLEVCRRAAADQVYPAVEVAAGLQAILDGAAKEFTIEYPCHSNSEQRWFLLHATPLRHGQGGAVVSHTNITDRIKAEQRLQGSEQRMRAILDTAVDAIIVIDAGGIIDSANPAAENLFGYSATEMIGRNVKMLMPPHHSEQHDSYLERYLRTGEKRIIGNGREVQAQRKDGRFFPVDLSVSEFLDCEQRMFTGMLRDLSSRKALEREVLGIAEEEQRRIGQELHDSVGQELTALRLLVETLEEGLQPQQPLSSTNAQLVAKLAKGLQRVLGQVRALSRGLIPVEVDAEGLMAALTELAARTSEFHGVMCTFDCHKPVLLVDNHTATHLYRIACEAVTNALRHAQARQLTISLEDNQAIILRVRDDGVGFPREAMEDKGMGLKIMRYRAGLMHAKLTIEPAEPTGTVVSCCIRGADGERVPFERVANGGES